jgi:hypothetical protein
MHWDERSGIQTYPYWRDAIYGRTLRKILRKVLSLIFARGKQTTNLLIDFCNKKFSAQKKRPKCLSPVLSIMLAIHPIRKEEQRQKSEKDFFFARACHKMFEWQKGRIFFSIFYEEGKKWDFLSRLTNLLRNSYSNYTCKPHRIYFVSNLICSPHYFCRVTFFFTFFCTLGLFKKSKAFFIDKNVPSIIANYCICRTLILRSPFRY